MSHSAKILADSISPDGVRLTTLEVTFPRIILAEVNTHRVFSRNSASSRAIPVEKMLRMVQEHPYIPTHWGKNQPGMQADVEMSPEEIEIEVREWLEDRDYAVTRAKRRQSRGLHKQIANRPMEPYMWHTAIISGTEFSNWDHLRANPQAHPEIQALAHCMIDARARSELKKIDYDQWHLPLITEEDASDLLRGGFPFDETMTVGEALKRVSVGRCARVSYLTHDGKRDLAEDIKLHDRLLTSGHMSPFEHVARPMTWEEAHAQHAATAGSRDPADEFCGNYRGWRQYRKEIAHEEDILAPH